MAAFQLSVELTRVFEPFVARAVGAAFSDIVGWARKLRRVGSDVTVEIDLAEVFGRGRIEPALENVFRNAVMQPFTITPIRAGSTLDKLELSTGAGQTLMWAENPIYRELFSSIVQLSFLGWTHDRTALATALSECLETRFENGLSPLQSPGFDGIFRTLEVCSSETSGFNWSSYVLMASSQLRKLVPLGVLEYSGDLLRLPPHILLNCLDFLYIVQRIPEERYMEVSGPEGALTLIIWAHYILGLSVLVKNVGTSDEVMFKNNANPDPVIIIRLNSSENARNQSNVCLYSKEDQLLLSPDPGLLNTQRIETRERLQLCGYGTITICRLLDEPLDTFIREPHTPHLVEAAEFTIAIAGLVSGRLVRRRHGKNEQVTRQCTVSSRILNAASILFGHPLSTNREDRLPYGKESAEKYCEMMQLCQTWEKVPLPRALEKRLESMTFLDGLEDFCELAATLVCLAMVPNLDDCAELKLAFAGPLEDYGGFFAKVNRMKGDITLESHDIFSHICRLLVGSDLFLHWGNSEDGDIFMVSDFGWTISLPIYGDIDPSTVDPESVYIFKGVPTNSKTLERKTRVRDGQDAALELIPAGPPSFDPVCDRLTEVYQPRCISPVQSRTEYVGSRLNGFHLAVKVMGTHLEHLDEHGNPSQFQSVLRYRGLHEALWSAYISPRCNHSRKESSDKERSGEAKLGMGVATAVGIWAWGPQDSLKKEILPERLVVVLVKKDKRSRWLAVAAASSRGHGRQLMIRGSRCCEDCAVQAAAELPREWAIVI